MTFRPSLRNGISPVYFNGSKAETGLSSSRLAVVAEYAARLYPSAIDQPGPRGDAA
jgi:hypothetical protein